MTQDIRVLVGDDDINDRFFLEWGFKEVCPLVHLEFARTGDLVVQALQDTSRPRPALLIIDSMMPRRDGFAVLEWVRARKEFDQLPVIMLSGQPYEKNEERARQLSVRSYIEKPHDLDELKALVQNWKQKYLDPIKLQPSQPDKHHGFQLLIGDSSSSFRVFIQKVAAEVCPDSAPRFFQDGVEVLKHFEENSQSSLSLLLLDLGTASIDVLKWLRRERKLAELPIIIWTSTPMRVEEELAREYGVTEYLKKPNTFSALQQSIYDFSLRYGATKDHSR
jgi:DNA-binding response OmpR family regulator